MVTSPIHYIHGRRLLNYKINVLYLPAMVAEINATEVDKQDKLTDQVYHYDVTDN